MIHRMFGRRAAQGGRGVSACKSAAPAGESQRRRDGREPIKDLGQGSWYHHRGLSPPPCGVGGAEPGVGKEVTLQDEEQIVLGVSTIVEAALSRRACHPPAMALLVGLSGIDGSGKGYLAGHLVTALSARRLKTAAINVDGWLNLPAVRFDPERPGENFYENALRLDELFARLVVPLRRDRSVRVTMDWVDETSDGEPAVYLRVRRPGHYRAGGGLPVQAGLPQALRPGGVGRLQLGDGAGAGDCAFAGGSVAGRDGSRVPDDFLPGRGDSLRAGRPARVGGPDCAERSAARGASGGRGVGRPIVDPMPHLPESRIGDEGFRATSAATVNRVVQPAVTRWEFASCSPNLWGHAWFGGLMLGVAQPAYAQRGNAACAV